MNVWFLSIRPQLSIFDGAKNDYDKNSKQPGNPPRWRTGTVRGLFIYGIGGLMMFNESGNVRKAAGRTAQRLEQEAP